MTSNANQVLTEALALPEPERAKLASELLASLGPEPSATADDDWIAEIERRARAAQAGEPGIPWEETRTRIQGRLRRR